MFDSDYKFKGKHATYIKMMNKQSAKNVKISESTAIFNSAIEIYIIAPLIGVAYQRFVDVDMTSIDETNILLSAFTTHKDDLEFVFRLVMLADETSGLTPDEKIDRAYRDDEDVEKTKENMALFHQYVRGGIEWLYENLIGDDTTKEDYVGNVYNVVEMFSERFEI